MVRLSYLIKTTYLLTFLMHFGYNNPNNIFLLGGHILETVDEEKDLSVMIWKGFEGF